MTEPTAEADPEIKPLAQRALRVALWGVVPDDDDSIIADLVGKIEEQAATIQAHAAALRQREAAEREACAKVADDYSWSMTQTAIDLGARGKPHIVTDSKADAGMSIALAIRSRGTP